MQNHDLVPVKQGTTYLGANITLPTGDAYLLHGALIEMKVRLQPNATVKLYLSSVNEGLQITGDYTFCIPAQVIEIPSNTYQYDIKITFLDGRKSIYLGGSWTILSVITD